MKIWIIFIINLMAVLAYIFYQPLCEPCLPNIECPPCRSSEQDFIRYSIIGIDIVAILFVAVNKINKVQKIKID